MKKGIKKSGKGEKSYSADHVSVMLEDMKDMMMAFGEGQEVFSGKVDVLSDKIDRMQDDLTDVKYKLSDTVDRVDFKKLEKRMIRVERTVFVKKA